jgi:hypothetical protein
VAYHAPVGRPHGVGGDGKGLEKERAQGNGHDGGKKEHFHVVREPSKGKNGPTGFLEQLMDGFLRWAVELRPMLVPEQDNRFFQFLPLFFG